MSTLRASSSLSNLLMCSKDDVRRIIMSSPTKLCLLDRVPTDMLNELVDILLPYLMTMVNASLRAGYLPASQKTATL